MSNYRSMWTDLLGTAITQRWVDAGGVKTRVLETGSADAPPLILLHGTGGHAEAYVRNMSAHAEHFHTYSMDMIGHGFTDTPKQSYEISDYVNHLKDFMDAEGIARASVSGESLGGWVAARFALKHPDRLDRLVLNTTGGNSFDLEVMKRITTLTQAAVREAKWDTVRKRLEFLMADPASVTDDLVAVRLSIYQRDGYVDTMDRILCLQEPETRRRNLLSEGDWSAIKAPTLVVWTTHDPTAAASVGEQIASWVPDSQYVIMKDCGHWPQFEDSETFNRLHIAFLQGEDNVSRYAA